MKSCMMLLGVTLGQIFKQMNIMWTKQVKPTDDYMFLNMVLYILDGVRQIKIIELILHH